VKKIAIFYISEFGGHNKAANNIKEALLYRNAALAVLTINGFGRFYPNTEKFVDSVYTSVIKYFPFIWASIYDKKSIIRSLNPLRKFANWRTFKKLAIFINDFSPDCFVATQAFPCGFIADFKKKFKVNIPLVAVVTDYHPHGFWIHPTVDKYVVASTEAKEVLVKNGVSAQKIEILGIPISFYFMDSLPKEVVARQLGFLNDFPAILIMGGGLGIGPIEEIAKILDSSDYNCQLIVVCGKNKQLYKWFESHKSNFRKPVFYFGYIDYVHKIMDFADIIVTKGGGITSSEALAKGLGIIVANPIPGQEEKNVNYLLRKEAICRADEPLEIVRCVKQLIEDRKKLTALKEKAKSISCADSSLKIADLILKVVS
jgi:processive 1,2-diacylglycerol beta-glucosyltransferase